MENKINESEADKKTVLTDILSGLKAQTQSGERRDSINEDTVNIIRKNSNVEQVILDLEQKIILLEKKNKDLKAKNESLTKNNLEKSSLMMKMSLVGLRRGFATKSTLNQNENKSIQLDEIIKEKDDLQQINEKMLDLLAEKEIENEDLIEKIENYKLETKLETEKYLEKIQNLEEKIESLENSKGNNFDIDSLVHEYNNYKERLKKQINDYIKNEGNLKQQLENKERKIQRLKEDIHGLEVENLQLLNQSKRNEKLNQTEIIEIEKLKSENDKIKREKEFLEEKLQTAEEKVKKEAKAHDEEISEFQKKIEGEQNYLKLYMENKSKEINQLKNEITKNNREMSYFSKRMDMVGKMLDDEKSKNVEIQNKLDKKSKELHDINEYTKKLLTNKENLLSQYEEKIDKITKDKNDLISQNKELLEKIKSKTEQNNIGTTLADIITEDENNANKEDLIQFQQENKILNEEVKNLKEQLSIQAKDLFNLNSLEKEIVKLKAENEILINDNKEINKKLDEKIKKEEQELLERKKTELIKAIKSLKKKQPPNDNFNKDYYEKKIEALNKLKDDEKNDYEEQIKKLKMELVLIKLRNLKVQNKNEDLLNNYRSAIKLLSSEYLKKYGIFILCAIVLLLGIKMVI